MATPRIGKPALMATIDASVNNIPTAYSEAAGSLALKGIPEDSRTHVAIYNATAGAVILSLQAGEGLSTAAVDNFICPPTGTIVLDNVVVSTRIYVRSSTGSAIAAAKLYISVW